MKVEIVCTGRGTHGPWRVGFILEVGDRSPVGAGCEQMVRDGTEQGTKWRLRCRRCGKDTEFTLTRWAVLVAGLNAVRAGRLDISRLPF